MRRMTESPICRQTTTRRRLSMAPAPVEELSRSVEWMFNLRSWSAGASEKKSETATAIAKLKARTRVSTEADQGDRYGETLCFDPDPDTTFGEAKAVRRLAAARGWQREIERHETTKRRLEQLLHDLA